MNGSIMTLRKKLKKKLSGKNENEHKRVQKLMRSSGLEREVHSHACLPKKHRNNSNKQHNPTATKTG